ncbi:LysE family translocator [Streptomyces sp. VRA16 Mangrove soil]|uniref:LysE family translocator n=1 Tax=Streptomyces sp. VRA16 Mangrove soil TaxID=2817434 RepID=UPI001A9E0A24|nr:LysE family transporter [Streptomyces sp. VRA16 Mangrove soil]MBO1330274.1 LysE family transporter [Streptomyces sp. VRA16 Mangrove soil]
MRETDVIGLDQKWSRDLRGPPAAEGGDACALLAVRTLRSATAPPAAAPAPPPDREILRRAVTTNLLNPKIILFFAAFLPRFTDPAHGPLWAQLLTLGLLFLLVGLVWDSTIGLCAGRLGRSLTQGRRTGVAVTVGAGATFAALAVLLLKDAVRGVSGL